MGNGQIPACSVLPFDGNSTTSGTYENERENKPSLFVSQVTHQNKFGHDCKNPRFYIKPAGQKRRFHVLEEAIRRIKKNLITPFNYPEFNQYLYNKEKGRKIRSEAREAELSLLLPAIADTVNLVRMESGYWEGSQFINYGYRKYRELTGMSESRVERHMLVLKKHGFIDVKKVNVTLSDGYRTEKVIITVSDKLFNLLGLEKQYLVDREKAIQNRNKIDNQEEANRRYLELYRNKKIKDTISNPAQDRSITNIGKTLVKRVMPLSKGNGATIKDAISNLINKGYSVSEAMDIVRKQYPPS